MAMPSVPPAPPAIEQILISSTETTHLQSQQLSWSMPNNNNLDTSFLLVSADTSSTKPKSSEQKAPKSTNAASTGIIISDIHYDGDVPKTEADEYVLVKNSAKDAVDVSGFYIYVATTGTQGPTYYFPKGTMIKSGASVRIYTNEIHKETGGYTFDSKKAIWSNNGGLAVLKDNNGKKLMEYKYKP